MQVHIYRSMRLLYVLTLGISRGLRITVTPASVKNRTCNDGGRTTQIRFIRTISMKCYSSTQTILIFWIRLVAGFGGTIYDCRSSLIRELISNIVRTPFAFNVVHVAFLGRRVALSFSSTGNLLSEASRSYTIIERGGPEKQYVHLYRSVYV